ncbi:alpha/beta hydrolase [Mycobacteroides stephanolepidis]|uniref:Alpha/beta hydrolase n=1 Tax=[Mycobacterium] stephanolepidis TaxID=1520670 RepID=A0A1Z4F452_9MYCO|nr:alpha/beta fold hydrolase [[Mycobacterium] stephanolepidis]BAX99964.1 alpha/beta hydrolase [[Mycobacterium] stephanolepidis]
MRRIMTFERQGLIFEVRDSGPEDGIPVVLLHGFPQTSVSWEAVARLLNDQGFRTWAPDQRGYSPRATPSRRRDYRFSELVADAIALIEEAHTGPVHLVGHDWGAGVAWGVADRRPDLLRTLTAVSVPHPLAFAAAALTSAQMFKSWYMLLLQLPWIPELLMRKEHGFFYRRLLGTGQTPENAARDLRDLHRIGATTTSVHWYRALPFALSSLPLHKITVPTLQVWSDGDTAVERRGHDLSQRHVNAPWNLHILRGVSHWIPDEAAEELAELVLDHFRRFDVVPPDSWGKNTTRHTDCTDGASA